MAGWRTLLGVSGMAFLLAFTARPADAQTIRGRVSDARTDAPIGNAVVALVDASGQNRAATAADSTGRFELGVPEPGSYRLRAEQFGYEMRESEAFLVDPGDEVVTRDVRLSPSPVPIRGVEVTTDQANRRIRQFLGMSPNQLRISPVRAPTIRQHADRGEDLVDLMAWRNIPNMQVLRSRTGPCFQFRGRDCLPVYLDGARLNRSSSPMLPLEMLNTIVVLLPSESVAYPSGAVLLFSTGFMR